MSDTVAAYWDARAESPYDAAQRLALLLDSLANIDTGAATWFEKGSASPRPDQAVDLSAEALAELFAKGVNRRDTDRSEIPELGYRISLWNGDTTDPVELTVQAGVTSSTPGISNSVVLKVPSTVGWRDHAPTVLTTLATAWDPARALWTTREYRRSQPTVDGVAMFGWLTYLTGARAARVTELPAHVTAEPVSSGTVFTAGTAPGEQSQALAAQLAALLAP